MDDGGGGVRADVIDDNIFPIHRTSPLLPPPRLALNTTRQPHSLTWHDIHRNHQRLFCSLGRDGPLSHCHNYQVEVVPVPVEPIPAEGSPAPLPEEPPPLP
jgi:hypothetical protein